MEKKVGIVLLFRFLGLGVRGLGWLLGTCPAACTYRITLRLETGRNWSRRANNNRSRLPQS